MDTKEMNKRLWSYLLYRFNTIDKILFLADVMVGKLLRPIASSICRVRGHRPVSQQIWNFKLVYCKRCGDVLMTAKE